MNENIFIEGDQSDSMGYISSGKVAMVVKKDNAFLLELR
jgi:hypothetical protein